MKKADFQALLTENGVNWTEQMTLPQLKALSIEKGLWSEPIPKPEQEGTAGAGFVLIAEDEDVALITLVGKRTWKKADTKNKYQTNYNIEHYYNFVYNGVPFTTVDERFVQAYNDDELAIVTFKYSGDTAPNGQKYIEIASFLTDASLEKIDTRRERKDERAFRKEMRGIKVKANPELIRSASDMDAIFTKSVAGQQ